MTGVQTCALPIFIDQRDILKPEDLDACHIAVVQEERFFVEPKTTEETQP